MKVISDDLLEVVSGAGSNYEESSVLIHWIVSFYK